MPAMTHTASDMKAALDLAAGMTATIRVARALATSGRQIDLSGIERDAGLLCARVFDLPPASGRFLRPHLLALLSEHDALAAALAAARPGP
jgi:hypothetical protein